jgi:surface antigen
MGTKFRTLLAPIGVSTGDGRRFADGGITLADLPMPLEWARAREGGHDGAVQVGAVTKAKVMTHQAAIDGGWIDQASVKGLDPKGKGVYAEGEMYDGIDREAMPRLAEDVAEAMHLATEGTLGPSVDLDSFEAKAVMAGTDDELSWEMVEEYMEANDGAEPPVELLVTAGRVRAATLVSIPAFSETSRPFELVPAEAEPADGEAADTEHSAEELMALVASIATTARPEVGSFTLPVLDGPTPITWDWERGVVFGHIATWATCHVGYADACVTPPREDGETAYSWFNRYAVETVDGGTIWAGRITVGGNHAGLALSATAAMGVHDSKTVAAYARAYTDEHGIVLAGVIEQGLTAGDRAILERRKVSGDWREASGALALVEVLALSPGPRSLSEPGFPVETHLSNGRQTALVACLSPDPAQFARRAPGLDVAAIVREARAEDRRQAAEEAAASVAREELAGMFESDDKREREALAALLGEE